MTSPRANRRWILGFTLIEVMAVTAIVTSMPVGAYARVQQKAHELNCKNNLDQIGKAIVMYHMNEGTYPKAAFYPSDPVNGADSIRRILEEAGSGIPAEMWTCPSAPDALRDKGLTFVYNSDLGGRSSLAEPSRAWVLIELNCVTPKVPMPHPAGYNILFADGRLEQLNSKELQTAIHKHGRDR